MEDDEVPEEIQEYAEKEVEPLRQQPQTINKAQLRAEVRHLVDLAIQSGLEPDDVEGVLRDLADGVPYFYEDMRRYAQQPDDDGDGG